MPGHHFNGTVQEQSTVYVDAGGWTDTDDNLYAWDGSTWQLIQPLAGGLITLNPPTNLTATNVDDHSVDIGWTNPSQPTEGPTEVQVKVVEIADVWIAYSYPDTVAFFHDALTDGTAYQVLVRYVRRVDGSITAVSTPASVFFSTTTAPIGPASPDPGGTGGDTIFPTGGDTGFPGPPSTVDGCWWEWELQILNLTTLLFESSGISGTEDGDAGEISYDISTLDADRVYRLCIREACDTTSDGVADTWGAWECSDPFPGGADWDATCAGISDSGIAGYDVLADAVWSFPKMCKLDGGTRLGMIDAVSGTEISRGANFASYFREAGDGDWGVKNDLTENGVTMVAGLAAVQTTVTPGQDGTFMASHRFSSGHTLSNGDTTTVALIAGGILSIRIVESATGWTVEADFYGENGVITLSSTEQALDAVTHRFVVTVDADGDKKLYLDGTVVDTDSSGDDWVTFTPVTWYATKCTPNGVSFQQAGWARVLTDFEISTLGQIFGSLLVDTVRGFSPAILHNFVADGSIDVANYGALSGYTASLLGTLSTTTTGADGKEYALQVCPYDSIAGLGAQRPWAGSTITVLALVKVGGQSIIVADGVADYNALASGYAEVQSSGYMQSRINAISGTTRIGNGAASGRSPGSWILLELVVVTGVGSRMDAWYDGLVQSTTLATIDISTGGTFPSTVNTVQHGRMTGSVPQATQATVMGAIFTGTLTTAQRAAIRDAAVAEGWIT